MAADRLASRRPVPRPHLWILGCQARRATESCADPCTGARSLCLTRGLSLMISYGYSQNKRFRYVGVVAAMGSQPEHCMDIGTTVRYRDPVAEREEALRPRSPPGSIFPLNQLGAVLVTGELHPGHLLWCSRQLDGASPARRIGRCWNSPAPELIQRCDVLSSATKGNHVFQRGDLVVLRE